MDSGWQVAPPVMRVGSVMLREVLPEDAPALLALLARDQVARVIAPPASSLEGLLTRIEAARLDRQEGRGLCLAVVTDDGSVVGLFRLTKTEPGFGAAEWEFVLAPEYWGQGLFFQVAPLVIDFAFDVLHAYRLEARAALPNARGNGALRKLGAIQEARLRQSLHHPDGTYDQALWTILADEWRQRTGRPRAIH
jgi:ribosomal-protein-alanine N-acetyltransferase